MTCDTWTGLDDFLTRARRRLDPISGRGYLPEQGDRDFVPEELEEELRPAGVLIGIIPRPQAPQVLLTLRPRTMAEHAGQVAFPGGKVDPHDRDEVQAALREADEEVGVVPEDVSLIARSAVYVTGTGFRITPVLGLLPVDFEPKPDPREVAAVFEAPLAYLLDRTNHQRRSAVWRGKTRTYYAIPHDEHLIWGVTAGIIRSLSGAVYGGEAG